MPLGGKHNGTLWGGEEHSIRHSMGGTVFGGPYFINGGNNGGTVLGGPVFTEPCFHD